jgi:hypothetical protein
VALLARQDCNPWHIIRKMQLSLAIQPLSKRTGSFRQGLPRNPKTLERPLNSTQEQASTHIGVVVGMADVSTIRSHPPRKITDKTRTIGTDHLKDDRGLTHHNTFKNKFSRNKASG